MNEVIETIKSRRSIRAYRPEKPKKDEMEAILEAGIFAPSGHNAQAWHFTVILDRAIMEEINAKAKQKMAAVNVDWIKRIAANPEADVTHKAPVLVIISAKKGAITGATDCVAAMQNMMIAAESLGIGSCWMGLVGFLFDDAEEMRKLGVPEGFEAMQAAVFGYKTDPSHRDPPPRNRDVVNYIGKF